ncbi:hypothetical protein [uncultured Clostridium sp.]|uniref:hypothetical protein n=1 Tax=uncultured Clostridium sp. TaxID=59620 RepID=UPI0025DA879C|nr:hypothetical protein [uncultured Clostridium sp.]
MQKFKEELRLEEIKVVMKESEEKLIKTVVDFSIKEGFTVKNIKDAMEKVYKHFEENAVLEKVTEI